MLKKVAPLLPPLLHHQMSWVLTMAAVVVVVLTVAVVLPFGGILVSRPSSSLMSQPPRLNVIAIWSVTFLRRPGRERCH